MSQRRREKEREKQRERQSGENITNIEASKESRTFNKP